MALPTAVTQAVTNKGAATTRINGKISDDGGESCEARFRWRRRGTLTIQPATKDTLVYQFSPTSNYGSQDRLDISDCIYNLDRPILEFSFSEIPAGATITSAKLYLYYQGYGNWDPVGKIVWAYKLTRTDWVELQATWNIYKTGSSWTTAGGDYVITNPSGGNTVFPANIFQWMIWDVLAIVQDAYTLEIPAEFLLRFETEDISGEYGSYAYFHSKEYTTNLTQRPKLVIEYAEAWTTTDWQNTLETNDTYYEDLTGLTRGSIYEFQTQAKNSEGEGDWSDLEYFACGWRVLRNNNSLLMGTGSSLLVD